MVSVLLTGGTSFTGVWFADTLACADVKVHLALRAPVSAYQGARQARLRILPASVMVHEGVQHGDGTLASLIREIGPDVVGFHAHPMDSFRDAGYDHVGAVAAMTAALPAELDAAAATGSRIVYSGTVYEPRAERPAVSAYGISKNTVWEHLRFGAVAREIPTTRFVIPNPFGPGEEGRFGNYLAATWAKGELPVVRTPDYVRDNIPVEELAVRYLGAVTEPSGKTDTVNPSGYIETQGEFALRVAREVGSRLSRDLPVDALIDTPHPEPAVVVNDGSHSSTFELREKEYWDRYANFVAEQLRGRD